MALNGRTMQWLCMQGVELTSEGNEQNRNELLWHRYAVNGSEQQWSSREGR